MKNETPIIINCAKITETPLAILVEIDGIETWLPKSQIEIIKTYNDTEATTLKVSIPQWLYNKNLKTQITL